MLSVVFDNRLTFGYRIEFCGVIPSANELR